MSLYIGVYNRGIEKFPFDKEKLLMKTLKNIESKKDLYGDDDIDDGIYTVYNCVNNPSFNFLKKRTKSVIVTMDEIDFKPDYLITCKEEDDLMYTFANNIDYCILLKEDSKMIFVLKEYEIPYECLL